MAISLARARAATRRPPAHVVGNLALAWALAYVPIHVYWAIGGLSTPIGITGHQAGFRMANWGACVIITGAGLTCLALTTSWGAVLPTALRRGTAWVGGAFGLAHWALYTTMCVLQLAGTVGYPVDSDITEQQMRNFDWANLGYFELWFGVMGLLLIACARRDKALRGGSSPHDGSSPHGAAGRAASSLAGRAGAAVSLAGIAIVIWGVFTFAPLLFAVAGPAILAAGLTILIISNKKGNAR